MVVWKEFLFDKQLKFNLKIRWVEDEGSYRHVGSLQFSTEGLWGLAHWIRSKTEIDRFLDIKWTKGYGGNIGKWRWYGRSTLSGGVACRFKWSTSPPIYYYFYSIVAVMGLTEVWVCKMSRGEISKLYSLLNLFCNWYWYVRGGGWNEVVARGGGWIPMRKLCQLLGICPWYNIGLCRLGDGWGFGMTFLHWWGVELPELWNPVISNKSQENNLTVQCLEVI